MGRGSSVRSTPSPEQKENEMWQPIETAPRDATAILVMRDIWPGTRSGRAEECNGHNTYVAAWWSDGGQGAWICYMDAVLDPECPVEPTHWMPLPDPPGAQQCKNCNGMGSRFDPSGEKIPCDLCESHLEEIRSLVAEAAHDIVSGSDFWLSISLAAKKIYALPGAKGEEK